MNRTEYYPILQKKYLMGEDADIFTFTDLEHTFHRMNEIFNEHERIAISVSGGSDSDCIIHLVCTYFPEYLDKCRFVFSNTGLELDATKRHLDEQEKKYGITIDRVRGMSVVTAVRKYGLPILSKYKANIIMAYIRGNPWSVKRIYPPEEFKARLRNDQIFSDNQIEMVEHIKRSGILISADCCVHCKKKPLHAYEKEMGCDLYVTGERKAEGGQRSIRQHSCFVEKKGADKYMPLFQWSDETKRHFKRTEGIRFSDCYEVWGMNRTGCTGCPFNINIAEDLQRFYQYEPRMYQACMKVFGQSYELMDRFNVRRKKCIPEVIQFMLQDESE